MPYPSDLRDARRFAFFASLGNRLHRRMATPPPTSAAMDRKRVRPSTPESGANHGAVSVTDRNRAFYDALWSRTYLTRPSRFNTWPLVSSLLPDVAHRLEIGPGLRPRLPVAGTHFVDLSPTVVERLNARGAHARIGEIATLPFRDGEFDLVAAFDVIEHSENDESVFSELTRVLGVRGHLIFSVPLHPHRWCRFDDVVGHARRYTPTALLDLLARHGLTVERSAVFGMQSNHPRCLDFAVLGLTEHFEVAVRCYNWLFFPLGMLLQRPLQLEKGLIDLTDVDEVLVYCRRRAVPSPSSPANGTI